MGIELSPPAFTTPLGYTYHIGDRISSIELDHIAAVGAIARVDEDHVWHTLPNVPGQEPVSIDRNSFERYLDTRYFEVSEPEPQRVIAAQHTEQPTPETPQAVQNLMGQRVEIDGRLYNVDSADEKISPFTSTRHPMPESMTSLRPTALPIKRTRPARKRLKPPSVTTTGITGWMQRQSIRWCSSSAMTAHFISSPSPSVKRTGTGAILPTTGLGPTPCPSPPILTHGVLTATAIWPSTVIPVWSICFSARPAKPTRRSGRKPLSGTS